MALTLAQTNAIRTSLRSMLEDVRRRDPAIHTIALGWKTVRGEKTAVYSLVFFTTHKETEPPRLPEARRIPESVRFSLDGSDFSIPTDVVEAPRAQFAYCLEKRPASGGNCVGTVDSGRVATLGGIVVDPQTDDHYIVSASHALTRFGTMPAGSPVAQPGNDAAKIIGQLDARGPVWPPFGGEMDADAALAQVKSADVTFEITDIPGVVAGTKTPEQDLKIIFRGASTDTVTSGEIAYICGESDVPNGRYTYTFSNVFLTRAPGTEGDSGALAVEDVADESKPAVGLLFALMGAYTMFASIDDVTAVLKIQGWHWGKPPS